ncbi:uncharacterized protein LOC132752123 [Ruditapes philippinarum]|uniref:uncharacterized protein LOC132752123 n=1 Tax=Ruditapes philippinarum TaxID=129788 RepID=UPI00295BF415|nr:uncharacterized protein LOC132752123 [Ruditapes philippinarum]
MTSRAHVGSVVCLLLPICALAIEVFSSSSSYSSSSSSSGGQIHKNTETVIENGKEVHYCSYKGMKFLPGSDFTDYEGCQKCNCTEEWFSCYSLEASVNIRSQVNGNNATCVGLKIGCATEWVLKANHSINCPQEEIPKEQPSMPTEQPFMSLMDFFL